MILTFLDEYWDAIQPNVPCGNSRAECVAERFLFPWNHDNANMDMICKAIKILDPRIVIELGTFEGYGTEKMARAMSRGTLYTFDAGGAPVNSLGETYGVTADYVYKKCLVDWRHIPFDGWNSFAKVIAKRDIRLAAEYPGVEVVFIQGMTFDTLPEHLPAIGRWDLLFQDTLHDQNSIIREWNIVKTYARGGGIIVFDDIHANHGIVECLQREKNWQWRHTPIGHQQLWGERI